VYGQKHIWRAGRPGFSTKYPGLGMSSLLTPEGNITILYSLINAYAPEEDEIKCRWTNLCMQPQLLHCHDHSTFCIPDVLP